MPVVVVGVDPGYRNLAWVNLELDEKTGVVKLVDFGHRDIGAGHMTQESIIYGVWSHCYRYNLFLHAHYVVIENQQIGKATKPNNVGISWLLATMALTDSPTAAIDLVHSMSKFTAFKQYWKLPTNTNIKDNAIYLACKLLKSIGEEPGVVFRAGCANEWPHLADALGLAFMKLATLGWKPPMSN